jgi:Arm DNA-binding domain
MAQNRILTALMVEKSKARPDRRYDLPDGPGGIPGLALRVSERGVKTFSLRYRVNGKKMGRITLGQHPMLSLGDARMKAREALALVEQGIDPAEAARAAKAASGPEPDRDRVEAVIEQYAARYLRRNTKRPRDAEQMLRRELRQYLDQPLRTITPRDVLELIDGIADRGSPVSANRALDPDQALLRVGGRAPDHRDQHRRRTQARAQGETA